MRCHDLGKQWTPCLNVQTAELWADAEASFNPRTPNRRDGTKQE